MSFIRETVSVRLHPNISVRPSGALTHIVSMEFILSREAGGRLAMDVGVDTLHTGAHVLFGARGIAKRLRKRS